MNRYFYYMFFCGVCFLCCGCLTSGAQLSANGRSVVAGVDVTRITDASHSVVKTVHLDAPQAEVFEFMTDFESIPDWLPGLSSVSSNHSFSQNGPGAVGVGTQRTCSAPGLKVHEKVVHFDPPHSFAYTMTSSEGPAVPLSEGTGVVSLSPAANGGTNLEYHVFYEPKTFHPMSPLVPFMLDFQLGGGMKNIADHFNGSGDD